MSLQMVHYKYEISYLRKHDTLGIIPHKFKTTDDAILLHTSALQKQMEEGYVVEYTVTLIGG